MPTIRTYAVGAEGRIKRLDNLSGPWINLFPINIGGNDIFFEYYDVEADPANSDNVIVVGRSLGSLTDAGATFGIYVSTDAGVTWTQPAGNYNSNSSSGLSRWYEVHYLDSNNIFVSGKDGYIAVSTDGGTTFNLSTQLPSTPTCPACIPSLNEVTSLYFTDATTGVVGLVGSIASTTDAGVTWTISPLISAAPAGLAVSILGIHMAADNLTINTLATNGMYRSTDGGATWTNTYQFINNVGRHLTWISDTEFWAFCAEGLIIKSIDAGLTWTVVTAQSPIGETHFAGHFYQGQNGFYSGSGKIYTTNDGATSGVLSDTFQLTVYAIWTAYPTPICYELVPCDESLSTIIVSNDLSEVTGEYIQICPENLPTNIVPPITGLAFTLQETSTLTRFLLQDCCGIKDDIVIDNYDLLSYQISGNIIQIDQIPGTCWQVTKASSQLAPYSISGTITGYEYANCITCNENFVCTSNPAPILTQCECFLVRESQTCAGAIELQNIETVEAFSTCEACSNQREGSCYLLTDCEDPTNTIVTADDLSQYVDEIVQIQSCPGYCFIVSVAPDCVGAVSVLPITASFSTCDLCNPPTPQVPTNLITRRVKPGYYTAACPPDYTEKVSCTFGEAMYEEVLAKRYGLENCCTIDAQKWTIKKELLDLKVLLDPNFITPTKVCTCYTIEQGPIASDYTYISCDGCLETITVAADQIEYLCAQARPKIKCPPAGVTYNIISLGTTCTSNTDCVPIPPVVECACYQFESAQRGDTTSYIECNGTVVTDVEVVSLGKALVCAQIGSIVLNNPETSRVTLISEGCTDDFSCAPCTCYEVEPIITPEGQSSISYINCNNEQTVQILTVPVFICAKEGSVTANNADVYNTLLECNNGSCGE
jgi:photosystem II stability/assembly factor-like uncharacterized protein